MFTALNWDLVDWDVMPINVPIAQTVEPILVLLEKDISEEDLCSSAITTTTVPSLVLFLMTIVY